MVLPGPPKLAPGNSRKLQHKLQQVLIHFSLATGSMYGICTYIYHINRANEGKYTIQGYYGLANLHFRHMLFKHGPPNSNWFTTTQPSISSTRKFLGTLTQEELLNSCVVQSGNLRIISSNKALMSCQLDFPKHSSPFHNSTGRY